MDEVELESCKVCSHCTLPKTLSEFSTCGHCADKHQAWCKVCVRAYTKGARPMELSRLRKQVLRRDPAYVEWEKGDKIRRDEEDPVNRLYKSAKARAKKSGVPFTISQQDIVIPKICPILGVEMRRRTRYAPTLDRIIPSKGYVPGNVMVISYLANSMKNSASIEELMLFSHFWIHFKFPD